MKGGQLARLAGQLCGNVDFQAFLGANDTEEAAEYLRTRCGITSRAELDHNKTAARRFHELRRAFVERQYA